MKKPSSPTVELLAAALRPIEKQLIAEFHRQLLKQYDDFAATLKADNMDAQIHFAYPNGAGSRREYVAQVAQYQYCNKATDSANPSGWRSYNEPNLRTFRVGFRESLKMTAQAMARGALDGFVFKMTAKIDATGVVATSIEYRGGLDPWSWSHIVVNGTQTWRTKMIVNVSCLGNLFNQWPTTLLK